jgi:carbamoyltransferase
VAIAAKSHAWRHQPWLRPRATLAASERNRRHGTKISGDIAKELNNDRILRAFGQIPGDRVIHIEHHLCHAASSFYASPFERSLILTFDEQGDGRAGAITLGEGSRLRMLKSIPFPHSLGWAFSKVTDLIGFQAHQDEHKTQWLGMQGEPVFERLFLDVLRREPGGPPRLSSRYVTRHSGGRIGFSSRFYKAIGFTPGDGRRAVTSGPQQPLAEPLRRQLAASIQRACTTIVAELAETYRKQTKTKDLCLGGGLFLNPVLVSEMEKLTGFERLFVQPAAGNEGTALGAAWYARHHLKGAARQSPVKHMYWGPHYSNHDVKAVLDNCKVRYRFYNSEDEKLDETMRWLEGGKIVAWYQGATEFGPRALGNRSLLASPWAGYVKENLNDYVKHREAFRPFAISVPADRAGEFFDASPSARFMATLGVAKTEIRDMLKDFLLPGGRVRLHVVERESNPALWQLLEWFGRRAPAPMLVNASFNLFGEPLVVSPRDAVRSYFCSGVDAMVMGSFSMAK